jgi:hypothetical protein
MGVAEVIQALSPKSWWKLDETGGTTCADSVGGITGTLVNGALNNQPPLVGTGRSVFFDNSLGSGIDFGDVYPFLGRVPFTALCFAQQTFYNTGSGATLWSNQGATADGWWLRPDFATEVLRFGRGDAVDFDIVTQLQANYVWNALHVYSCRYDGSVSYINVDGVDVIQGASTRSMTNDPNGLRFGARNVGGSGFQGYAQHLAIWDRALSQPELAAIASGATLPYPQQRRSRRTSW